MVFNGRDLPEILQLMRVKMYWGWSSWRHCIYSSWMATGNFHQDVINHSVANVGAYHYPGSSLMKPIFMWGGWPANSNNQSWNWHRQSSQQMKVGHPKGKLVFQASVFRCYVSCNEGNVSEIRRFIIWDDPKIRSQIRGWTSQSSNLIWWSWDFWNINSMESSRELKSSFGKCVDLIHPYSTFMFFIFKYSTNTYQYKTGRQRLWMFLAKIYTERITATMSPGISYEKSWVSNYVFIFTVLLVGRFAV